MVHLMITSRRPPADSGRIHAHSDATSCSERRLRVCVGMVRGAVAGKKGSRKSVGGRRQPHSRRLEGWAATTGVDTVVPTPIRRTCWSVADRHPRTRCCRSTAAWVNPRCGIGGDVGHTRAPGERGYPNRALPLLLARHLPGDPRYASGGAGSPLGGRGDATHQSAACAAIRIPPADAAGRQRQRPLSSTLATIRIDDGVYRATQQPVGSVSRAGRDSRDREHDLGGDRLGNAAIQFNILPR